MRNQPPAADAQGGELFLTKQDVDGGAAEPGESRYLANAIGELLRRRVLVAQGLRKGRRGFRTNFAHTCLLSELHVLRGYTS